MPFTGAITFVGVGDGLGVGLGDAVTLTALFLYPAGQMGFFPATVRTFFPFVHLIVDASAGAAMRRDKESAEIMNPDKFFNLRTM